MFLVPCHKHLHARFDATSKSECSQCFSKIAWWFISEGFLGKHFCLPRVPLHQEWPCSVLVDPSWVHPLCPQDGDADVSFNWVQVTMPFIVQHLRENKLTSLSQYLQSAVTVQLLHVLICFMLFQLLQNVVPDLVIRKYSKYSVFDLVGSWETGNEWWLNIMMIIMVKVFLFFFLFFLLQVILLCELLKRKTHIIHMVCRENNFAQHSAWDGMTSACHTHSKTDSSAQRHNKRVKSLTVLFTFPNCSAFGNKWTA